MILPIGDVPNPSTKPIVNWALIALNVVVFLAVTLPLSTTQPDLNDPVLLDYLGTLRSQGQWPVQMISAYDLVVFEHGFRPAEFSITGIFSAMFLHAGWMHLLGNMLFLWIYGDNVEHRLGHACYLIAYLGAGVAATLFFALFVPNSQIPMIGASGAISGVLGFYFLWFPRNRIKVLLLFFPLLVTTLLIPARVVLGVYLVIDNVLPFLTTSAEGGGVAYGAHIGGFLTGLGVAAMVDRLPSLLHLKGAAPHIRRKRANLVDTVTDIVRSIDRGDLAHAAVRYRDLSTHSQRTQLATHHILEIGNYLLDNSAPEQALSVFRRMITERPGDANLDSAYLGAGRAMLNKTRCETAAWHYLTAAIDLTERPEIAEEALHYIKKIERDRPVA
ncbi:MAG: rhomboid family intramembrane serine protease [Desulfuromonadales bacterium]|nr:rhomboid family intramembrane serine protease [Desulfuromonadales bacterium]